MSRPFTVCKENRQSCKRMLRTRCPRLTQRVDHPLSIPQNLLSQYGKYHTDQAVLAAQLRYRSTGLYLLLADFREAPQPTRLPPTASWCTLTLRAESATRTAPFARGR